MSSRASRLSDAVVTPFPWGHATPGTHQPPDRPSTADAGRTPADAGTDQQARLAALEREAFTKGYAQGERAGLEAAERRADGVLRKLGETLDELASLRSRLLQQSERQVVQLALALARRVVHREVVVDEELAGALARVALDRLGEAGPATVRLHPEDYGRTAARHAESWKAANISVVADPSVARGGCLVESPFGFVDAGIDAQFEELARAMLDDAGVTVRG